MEIELNYSVIKWIFDPGYKSSQNFWECQNFNLYSNTKALNFKILLNIME